MIIEFNGAKIECLDTEEAAAAALKALGYRAPGNVDARKGELLALVKAAHAGERLNAIKLWRGLTTDGLADSKDVIDQVIPPPVSLYGTGHD